MVELDNFMKAKYPYYKSGNWQPTLERYANKAEERKLSEVDGIYITKAELEKIEELKNKVLERLAFTLLCLAKFKNAKFDKNNNWVKNSDSEIFKLARISAGREKKDLFINDLNSLDYIEYANKNDNLSLRVTYIDENSENVLYITDFRELGYEYWLYKGDSLIRCSDCGILIRNNKQKNRKYCTVCAAKSRYEPIENKTIECIDCKSGFVVDARNMTKTRCDACQKEYRKKWDRDRKRRKIQN